MGDGAEQFLRRFAAPLVAGRAPACGDFIGARAAERMGVLPSDGEHGSTLWNALRSRAANIDPGPPAPPGRTLTLLLCAAHDLLASVHPDEGNLFGGTARAMRTHARGILARGVPESLPEALARHAGVEAMCQAVRIDVTVRWWTGSAEFHGTEPPKRLLAWPELRHVRQQERRVPLVRQALNTGGVRMRAARRELIEAMFTVSPLSPLLLAMDDASALPLDLRQPLLQGDPSYASLRFVDHEPLRTALADRALASGFIGAIIALSAAVNALLTSASPPAWAVERALSVVNMLHERRLFVESLTRQEAPRGRAVEPFVKPEALAQPAQRMVWALWCASRQVSERLGRIALDQSLLPLVREADAALSAPPVVDMTASFVRAIEARLETA